MSEQIKALLMKGQSLVLIGKIEDAKSIYEEIRSQYNAEEDEGHVLYREILDFYSRLE